jgi:hypothetical protein
MNDRRLLRQQQRAELKALEAKREAQRADHARYKAALAVKQERERHEREQRQTAGSDGVATAPR